MSNTKTTEVNLENSPLAYLMLLTGEVNQDMADMATQRLLEVDFQNKANSQNIPMTLIINSPGGELNAAWQICDMMDFIDTPVYTTGVGSLASAALIIFMNGQKGHRTLSDRSSLMSHRYSLNMSGTHTELIAFQPELQKVHNRILNHYCECTGMTNAEVEKTLLKAHDVWFTPKEAVKYGIADNVASTKKTKALKYEKFNLNKPQVKLAKVSKKGSK